MAAFEPRIFGVGSHTAPLKQKPSLCCKLVSLPNEQSLNCNGETALPTSYGLSIDVIKKF